MGVIEALANPSRKVRRLLELARTWPDTPPLKLPVSPTCKIARQLRSDEVDKVVEAYKAGATTHELGLRFGVWRATIGRHLKARGIDTRPPALEPGVTEEAVRLYRTGWTLAKLAKRYSVAPNTIRTHLVVAGVMMRPRGRKPATVERPVVVRRRPDKEPALAQGLPRIHQT